MTIQACLTPLLTHALPELDARCKQFIAGPNSLTFAKLEQYCEQQLATMSLARRDAFETSVLTAVKALYQHPEYRELMITEIAQKQRKRLELVITSTFLRRMIVRDMSKALNTLHDDLQAIAGCPLNHLPRLDENNVLTRFDIVIALFANDRFDDSTKTYNFTCCKQAIDDLCAHYLNYNQIHLTGTVSERVWSAMQSCFEKFRTLINDLAGWLARKIGYTSYVRLSEYPQQFFAPEFESHRVLKRFMAATKSIEGEYQLTPEILTAAV